MILSTKCLQVNSLRPLKAITTVFQIYILQPYDLEPEIASSDVSTTTSDENTSSSNSEIADYSRIGNTSWCSCGKCFPMSTYTESLCCRDTNEVADEYFEGNHNYKHPAC